MILASVKIQGARAIEYGYWQALVAGRSTAAKTNLESHNLTGVTRVLDSTLFQGRSRSFCVWDSRLSGGIIKAAVVWQEAVVQPRSRENPLFPEDSSDDSADKWAC
jgi:hypothetical protein